MNPIGCGNGIVMRASLRPSIRSSCYAAQFSSLSFGTRPNSRVLFVTSVTASASACAAIHRSLLPMGVPARYIHSHVSMIDRRDFDATVKLLVALVKRLDQKTVASLT